jgi:membrane protein YqaA with SNARE-associated domain
LNIVEIVRVFTHNPFFLEYGLAGLFLNGLLSSVIPIPTELTATALLAGGESRLGVFIVLSSSSIIGGFLAYYLGRTGESVFGRLQKKPTKNHQDKGHALLLKYGWLAIFLCSWIPILGDVIPIVAGGKGYDFRKFAVAMSMGKMIKVIAIVYISSYFATTFFLR